MATRQDSQGPVHTTRSTSSYPSASSRQAAHLEREVTVETVKPPLRATLRRVFIALLVICLLRVLLLFVGRLWTVTPYGHDPTELRCVIHGQKDETFLYCNRDCVPRFPNEDKLANFTELYPSVPTYIVHHPFVLGQSTKYCISFIELELVWLPLKLQRRKDELVQLKHGNRKGPWPVLA